MDSYVEVLLALKEAARTAHNRYHRLINPTRNRGDSGVIKHAEDLWLEAAAAVVLHEDNDRKPLRYPLQARPGGSPDAFRAPDGRSTSPTLAPCTCLPSQP